MPGQEHRHTLPPGHQLGRYRLVNVLGVGGFGVTYVGEHLSLGHTVAIKEYLPNEFAVREGVTVHPKSDASKGDYEWGLARFVEEARTLTKFRHPNLVRVSDHFQANNTAYIVMDYEDGQPLDVLLEQHGTLTEAQLKRIVMPIADGLKQVHAAGFLHRDIKPANIFVRRADESPVLIDFGAARQSLGSKSKSMTVIASAGYSPPEQYDSQGEQGPWTDIYALSALCYRAVTGKPPMDAIRRQSALLQTQTDPLPSLAQTKAGGCSKPFLLAIDQGMQIVASKRPQNVGAWLEAMQHQPPASPPSNRHLEEQPLPPTSSTDEESTARNLLLSSFAVVFGFILCVLIWSLGEHIEKGGDAQNDASANAGDATNKIDCPPLTAPRTLAITAGFRAANPNYTYKTDSQILDMFWDRFGDDDDYGYVNKADMVRRMSAPRKGEKPVDVYVSFNSRVAPLSRSHIAEAMWQRYGRQASDARPPECKIKREDYIHAMLHGEWPW